MVLHCGFEPAFNVFLYLVHQAKIDLLDFATLEADEMMVVFFVDVAAEVIPQLTLRVCGRQKDPAVCEAFEDSINSGKSHPFELLLQPRTHLVRVENSPTL